MEENAEEIINEAVEIAGVNGAIDQGIEQELQNLDQLLNQNPAMHNIQVHIPIQNQDIDNSEGAGAEAAPTGDSVIIIERDEHNTIHEFAHSIREAASLFSTYNKTLRLIESSAADTFSHWAKLTECVAEIATHPRVTEKMKMRCFLINKDNVTTFKLLQEHFKLDLDNLFFMGKMVSFTSLVCISSWHTPELS